MRLAIIPARGGSKRVPRKNVRDFAGRPMVTWSIRAALESGCFDQVVVSTDDEDIARVACEAGARVPFMRPAELSDDHTGTQPVIRHALNWHLQQGLNVEQVCCIYATAPFLRAEDVRGALARLQQEGCDYVFSVTRYAFPVQRAIRLDGMGRVQMLFPEHFSTRSQDLDEVYHDAGQFYWGQTDAWMQEKAIFSAGSMPWMLPRERVQDIDTPEDWAHAEVLFRVLQERDGQ